MNSRISDIFCSICSVRRISQAEGESNQIFRRPTWRVSDSFRLETVAH